MGSGGLVVTPPSGAKHVPQASLSVLAALPDGGFAAAGYFVRRTRNSESYLTVLGRYTPRGVPDATFGQDGLVRPRIGVETITAQPDGKILVLGSSEVVRYNANGSLDDSFGDGGRVTLGPPSGYPRLLDLTLQTDGRIVIAAEVNSALPFTSGTDVGVLRLLPDGSHDQTFGVSGQATLNADSTFEGAAVALDSDGRIVVSGTRAYAHPDGRGDSGSADIFAARFLVGGQPDPSFGANGIALISPSDGFDENSDLVVQGQRPVLAGSVRNNFSVLRLTATGQLDAEFGGGIVELGRSSYTASALTLTDSGEIIAIGEGNDIHTEDDVIVVSLRPDGQFDPTFGRRGRVHTDVYGGYDDANSVAIVQGRILVAGSAERESGGIDSTVLAYRFGRSGRPDRDGDFVSDERDDCPGVAGPARMHGCPRVSLKVGFYLARRLPGKPLQGVIDAAGGTYERWGCRIRAPVTLFEVQPGRDRRVARTLARGSGGAFFRFDVKVDPRARYYVSVPHRLAPKGGICLAARSLTVPHLPQPPFNP